MFGDGFKSWPTSMKKNRNENVIAFLVRWSCMINCVMLNLHVSFNLLGNLPVYTLKEKLNDCGLLNPVDKYYSKTWCV